jgi:hypothetical protein
MEHSQWQSLLKLGNDCFYDNHLHQAVSFYSKAYDMLALGYKNSPHSADILMAWVCACHNLSSVYEALGDLDLSLKFLKVPYDYLMDISVSNITDEEVKLIAFQGISLTITPILMFAKKYPMCDECQGKFGSLKSLIKQDKTLLQ